MSTEETQKLPAGWRWAKIMEVADRLSPGQLYGTRGLQQSGAIPIVTQSEGGYAGYHDNAPGVLASPEEPIVTFANHTCAVRLHCTSFSTIQNVFPLRGKIGIADTYFLYWLLKNRIPHSFYGGHWPKVVDTALPLPPLSEQKRIATILTEQMAAVEKARTAAEERLQAAKELPAAYLREVFESEEAQGWPVKSIGDFAKVQSGYAFKSEWFTKSGVRLLRNANVFQGYLEWSDVVHIPEDRRHEFPSYEMFEGDIVLSLDRPWVSSGLKVSRLTKKDLPCLLLQRVGRFCINDGLDHDYLYIFLNSPAFIDEITGHDQSLGVPHVSPKQIEAIEIPVPPMDRQQEIAQELNRKKTTAESITAMLEDELNAICRMPAALLRQAFQGEL